MGMGSGRILITGVTGFAGRAVAAWLLKKGYKVVGSSRMEISHAGFPVFSVLDLKEQTDWKSALEDVEVVVHLAARAHQMADGQDAAILYHEANVIGTEVLAMQAAEAGVRHFICISSTKAVITTSTCEILSEDTPCKPLDPYGVAKYQAELAVAKIACETGMAYTVLRPPLMYGPEVKGNMASLISLIRRLPFLPLGGISNSRSLLAVKNLASIIETVILNEKAYGKTYMISDGEKISTSELARILAEVFNPRCHIINMPGFFWNAFRKLPLICERVDRLTGSLAVDSSLIERELGWKPVVSMEEQLQEML